MMKAISSAMVCVTCLLAACAESSPRGGGMASEDSFRLVVPREVTVQQGAVQTIDVALDRGDLFKQDVKLDVKGTKGISADPSDSWVKAADNPSTLVKISADKDAPLGDYRLTLTGTPGGSGQSTMTEITVKVVKP